MHIHKQGYIKKSRPQIKQEIHITKKSRNIPVTTSRDTLDFWRVARAYKQFQPVLVLEAEAAPFGARVYKVATGILFSPEATL